MAPRTALLFDLDETLLDFERSQRLALRDAFRDLRLAFGSATIDAYRAINGRIWREYEQGRIGKDVLSLERFRRLTVALDHDPEISKHLSRIYLRRLSTRADLLPGCLRVLAAASRRHRLAVVTNGIDRVQRSRLRLAGLRDRFHTVVTSESCGFAKPDPRIVEIALRRVGASPENAIFIGDNPTTDGDAAHGAGVRFVWLDRAVHRPPRRRPYRHVTSLAGLARLIREL